MSLFSLCVCTARGTSPQETENFRAHRDRGPPGVAHMSCWWEGKKPSSKWLRALFLLLHVLKLQMLLLRVRLRWRATWRVWPVSWRLTCQTTKTKSCAYYVLCKSIDLVPLHHCMIPLLPHMISIIHFLAVGFQCPPPPREADRVHDLSGSAERQELQLWRGVCGGHDQTAQGDSEKQLVWRSRLLGMLILDEARLPVWTLFAAFCTARLHSCSSVVGAFSVRLGQLPRDRCSVNGGHVRELYQCYSGGRCPSGRSDSYICLPS